VKDREIKKESGNSGVGKQGKLIEKKSILLYHNNGKNI
jgi:hypothetical protein